MTKIKNYPLDLEVNGGDKWIGTDSASLAKLTKNFTPDNLAKYYNDKEVVESVNQLRFFYDTVDPGDDRANGSFSFETEVGPIVPFSSISNLVFSKYTMGNDVVNNFMTDIVNSIIIIQKADNPNIYAFYALNSYEVDPLNSDFYNVSITYSSGTGSIEEDEDYLVSLIQFAGAAGIQTILGSEFIDSSLTGIGEVTLSLSATGTPSNLTGLRGDNTWGTLGLEALDEGGRQGFGSANPAIGWRLIGRDPSLYGDIGQGSIDFSQGYFEDQSLPFGGSITNSPQIGSTGPGSFTYGSTVENNSNGGIVFGTANVLNGGPNIEPTYFVGGVVLGQYNQSYGLNYFNFTSGYKNLIGDRTQTAWSAAGFPYPYPVQYWSGQIGMYNQMPAGFASAQIGYGLLSSAPGSITVGVANSDETLQVAENTINNRNALNPRFVVGCGTFAGNSANPSVGVRQNGFVVMSDGTAKFPILTNSLIDSANDDSAVTKGWVNAQGTGTPTGLEAIDEGNGTGWRLIGRDAANYGNIGANALDFSVSNSASAVNGSTGSGSVTFGINNQNSLNNSIVNSVNTVVTTTSNNNGYNFIQGENQTIYNNVYDSIISGFRSFIGTSGASLSSAVVYDSIAIGDNLNMYAGRNSGMIGQALLGGSVATTIVGVANVDLTTTTANNLTADFNNLAPRFIVGTGTWNPPANTGTRANGFVVMSDGNASFPSLTNGLIDAANDDSAVTKGWVLAQTDVNTTYDLASTQNGTDVDVTLTGSDATVDTVKLVAGANIVLTDSGTSEITIDASGDALSAEQVRIEVKNTSGVTLTKGTPVYITGTVGATARVQIAAADASDPAKMPTVGVLAQDLINNADGFAITGGFLNNVTTDPIDGLTPVANQTVYVKPGGGLTLTKPINGNLIQNIAKVGKISGGNAGSLVVSSILRTNDVPNLTTGKIWVGTPTYTSESTVVHLDESNGRMGIGTTSPSEKLHISSGYALVENTGVGSAIIINRTDGKALNLKAGSGASQFTFDNTGFFAISSDTKTNVLSGAGAGNQVFVVTGSGNVGIGTTSPSNKLSVYGSTRIDQSADWDGLNIYGFDDQAADYIKIHIGTTPMARYQSNLTHSFYVGNSRNLDINDTSIGFSVDSIYSDDLVSIFGTDKDSYLGYSNTDDKFKIGFGSLSTPTVDSNTQLSLDGSGVYVENNLGVGTATPAAKLDVNGGIRMADDATAASALNVGTLRYRSDANNSYVDMSMQTGASTYAWVNIVQNNW